MHAGTAKKYHPGFNRTSRSGYGSTRRENISLGRMLPREIFSRRVRVKRYPIAFVAELELEERDKYTNKTMTKERKRQRWGGIAGRNV